MINILSVFKKQWKDTLKNKTVLIQFIMFPALTVIMNRAMQIEGMPENFFVHLFAVMYIGMAPLTSMAAIVSEEKEKNTLRVLLLVNVKPWEYLLGVGSYVWLLCMLGSGVFCLEGQYFGKEAFAFLAVMAVGILCSLLFGAAIGVWSRNQMMATSITVPVMLIFSFLPMLSLFNERIEIVARFFYSQQISAWMNQTSGSLPGLGSAAVLAANLAVGTGFFVAAYRKRGLAY